MIPEMKYMTTFAITRECSCSSSSGPLCGCFFNITAEFMIVRVLTGKHRVYLSATCITRVSRSRIQFQYQIV